MKDKQLPKGNENLIRVIGITPNVPGRGRPVRVEGVEKRDTGDVTLTTKEQ